MSTDKSTHLTDREDLIDNNAKSNPESPQNNNRPSQDALRHEQDAKHHKNRTNPAVKPGTNIPNK